MGGASGSFTVNTNPGCPWTATVANDDPWISIVSAASGSGEGSVTFSAQANNTGSERTGLIAVAGQSGVAGQSYTVRQFGKGCSFFLDPAELPASPSGGSAVISVIASGSNCPWTASGLSVTPTGGTGSSAVTVTINPNASASTQTLTATIAGQTLTVTEAGTSCAVTLGVSSASFSAAGGPGSLSVNVAPGCPYRTITDPNWISVISGNSTGPGTLDYFVSPNSTTTPRTGSFSVGGQSFTVTQQGQPCSVTVDTSDLGTPYPSTGGDGVIAITTNGPSCAWTASSANSWLTVSPSYGTGSSGVAVSAKTKSTTSRTTTLTIAGQTVNVTQGGTVCSYSLRSSSGSVPASGADGLVGVIAPSNCTWSSSSSASWLSITSSGNAGTSEVRFGAEENKTGALRTGTLIVAGLTYTVSQPAAPCTYSFASPEPTIEASGGTSSVGFSTLTNGCSPSALSYASWITVSTKFSGTAGTVTYTVAANPSGSSRMGNLQIGQQVFTITQLAPACGFDLSSIATTYYQDGTGGATLTGSWTAQGCPEPTDSTNQPAYVTLGPITGPVNDSYTLTYGIGAYDSITPIPRILDIVFGGRVFRVKQYPWK
jgi:hypothetical protein